MQPNLITPQEAIKIFELSSTYSVLMRADSLYKAWNQSPCFLSGETFFDKITLLAFMYQTGRIEGIREERAKKKGVQ